MAADVRITNLHPKIDTPTGLYYGTIAMCVYKYKHYLMIFKANKAQKGVILETGYTVLRMECFGVLKSEIERERG